MRRITAIGLLLALLAALTTACRDDAPARWPLVIVTGGQGGVYYDYGRGLAAAARAHLPGADPRVVATAASVENLQLVGRGRADVGFTLADSAALAAAGRPPFTARQPVSALARLYDNYFHLVVAASSGITDLAGLRGKTVSMGAPGSGTELTAGRLLSTAGMDGAVRRRQMSVEESAAALRAGGVDAFFFSGGLPATTITQLAKVLPIRLLDLGASVGPMRGRYGEFYEERTIPAWAYGLPGPARTLGVPNYLVVNAAMPADRAHALTRLLFTQKDALVVAHPEALHLDRRAAISTDPLPLHPGAARYYRESKRAN